MHDLPMPPSSALSPEAVYLSRGGLDVKRCRHDAWNLFKNHFGPLMLLGAGYLAVFAGLEVVGRGLHLGPAFAILRMVIMWFLMALVCSFLLHLVDTGKLGFNRKLDGETLIRFLIQGSCVQLGTFLFIVLGFCLLIVPGLYFAIRLTFVNYVFVDNAELGIGEVFSTAWSGTRNHFWPVVKLALWSLLIILLGLACLGIGIFPALMIIWCMQASAYRQLFPVNRSGPVSGVDLPPQFT